MIQTSADARAPARIWKTLASVEARDVCHAPRKILQMAAEQRHDAPWLCMLNKSKESFTLPSSLKRFLCKSIKPSRLQTEQSKLQQGQPEGSGGD